MGSTYPRACSEPPKVRGTIHVHLDFAAHAPYQFRLRATRRVLWAAAQAGAESRPFRGLGYGEELHLLRARAAGRTGWPAIDSRRTHSIDERAVQAWVAGSDSREASSSRWRLKCRSLICWLRHESWNSFRKQHIGTDPRRAIRILRSNLNLLLTFTSRPRRSVEPAGERL